MLRRILGEGTDELETKRLCIACAEITGMSGAGIMLMSGDVPPWVSLYHQRGESPHRGAAIHAG